MTTMVLGPTPLALMLFLAVCLSVGCASLPSNGAAAPGNARDPRKLPADELKDWLTNMLVHHRFTRDEVTAATGLSGEEIDRYIRQFKIKPEHRPARPNNAPLLVLPYPGGRHPRIGFLDGAINPQRETKISVFTPWDQDSYVVVDVPEAIWSNLGLIYLAHTHVPTVWTNQGIELPKLEWQRRPDGLLVSERTLPNQIQFRTEVRPDRGIVWMDMWLTNGTSQKLTGLVVQVCAMLKAVKGFNQQSNDNKLVTDPYVACRSEDGRRWIITAWSHCHRPWANPPVPCMHSDPRFPDCEPGQRQHIRGFLSFYEGTDVQAEFKRLEGLEWQKPESR